ncbi:hypothetical protein BJN34_21250 [Cupriavidus necator]|uniref:Uncharacterized protein n=1 Tax=Cupriavidus necator TaxID=106590 RepID=A0A1U9UUM8_CUPNE|nr:hypothetical protein [Cupriavidus necator]AQV96398.1 hypothetical protein BJN34_21250 [Cupriavidus necator]
MNFESIAIRGSLVSPARLMSPSEVRAATTNHPGLLRPLGGWYLCGDASARIVDAIVRNGGDAAIRLTGFVGPSGGHYVVLTHQLGSSQHRFLLPQYEPPVELYLRSLESQPIQVMLGRQGGDDSVVLHNRLPWPHIVPLVEMCQVQRCASVATTFDEMRAATFAVTRLERIPSLDGNVAVSDVSVSLVVPSEYCLQAIRRGVSTGGEPK